jgi:eukaryotic-like serine/threonine-protein kinase
MPIDPRVADLLVRYEELRQQGTSVSPDALCSDCPDLLPALRHALAALAAVDGLLGGPGSPTPTSGSPYPTGGAPDPVAHHATWSAALPGYEILGELGRGGMGVVYKARQRGLNRLVALKMILAPEHAGPRERARFTVEAEAVAQLQHPNVVQVYEVGAFEGRAYLALEFVDGGSLAAWTRGQPQSPATAARLVETLAGAMHYAHQRGIVHRDLKPSNVLLAFRETPRGARLQECVPKITDFGLAKRFPADGAGTASGAVLGTPQYMAPEQASGQGRDVGPAADVYGLGVIFYELLTGRPPFRGTTLFDTLEQVRSREPVPPRQLQPNVPPDLETVCLKCLQKEPSRRYASALALAEDLRRFRNHEPVHARPAGRLERLAKWTRRRPVWAALILVSVLSALTLTAIGVGLWRTVQRLDSAQHLAEEERGKGQRERDRARQKEAEARRFLYAADMKAVQQFWERGDVKQMLPLLARYEGVTDGEHDGRGFEWHYFNRLARHSEALTLHAGQGELYAVAFALDGKTLATGGQDGTVKLWDPASRRLRATLRGHTAKVTWLAFLADGKTLATTGADRTARLWDADRGEERGRLDLGSDLVQRLTVSPDGRLVAGALRDGGVRVWFIPTGQRISEFGGKGDADDALVFAPTGAMVAVAGSNFQIGGWYVNSGERVLLPASLASTVLALAFTPDGRRLAAGTRDGNLRYFTFPDFQSQPGPSLPVHGPATAHTGAVRCLAFAADGSFLASGGDDGVVRVWDQGDARRHNVFKGHQGTVWSVAVSPDGRVIASAGADGTVKLWPRNDRPDRRTLVTPLEAEGPVVFTPDGKIVAAAGANGDVHLVDVVRGAWTQRLRGGGHVRLLTSSPDGAFVVAVADDGTVRRWPTAGGAAKVALRLEAPAKDTAMAAVGQTLVCGRLDGSVTLWDVAAGTQRLKVEHGSPVVQVALAPDGKALASAGSDGTVKVWDAATGKERGVLTREGEPAALAFAHRGGLLAVALERTASLQPHRVVFWNVVTGQQTTAPIPWFMGASQSLTFAPDDRLLAVATTKTVMLLDPRTATLRHDFNTLTQRPVRWPAFAPDGRTLATCRADGTLELWDLSTWTVRPVAGQRPRTVRSLAFTEDSSMLITGRSDCEEKGALTGQGDYANEVIHHFTTFGRLDNARRLITDPDDLRLWEVASGRELPPLPGQASVGVLSLALLPDGHTVLAGSQGGVVWRYDVPARRRQPPLFVNSQARAYWELMELAKQVAPARPEYDETVRAIAVAPGHPWFATASDEGSVQVWDAARGVVRTPLPLVHHDVACLAFSPDGATLTANDGGDVCLWSVPAGKLLGRLAGGREALRCLAFSPDGKLLATGGYGRQVHLWALQKGTKQVLHGHTETVTSLAFTPDGKTLASTGWDATVRLWHVATGQEMAVLRGHIGPVNIVAFSPNGRTLASGGAAARGGREVYLWDREAAGDTPRPGR